jgi:hypothetical protein
MSLPVPVYVLLVGAPAVGFSGSRAPVVASVAAARAAVAVATRPILVGDQRGIDTVVRSARAGAQVFHAASAAPGHLAARSIACVQACVALGGVWAAFPAGACPAGLRPSPNAAACFSGRGSGSWASLAFAVGLGLPSVVFLPAGVAAPWAALVAAGDGWWVARPPAEQLALF